MKAAKARRIGRPHAAFSVAASTSALAVVALISSQSSYFWPYRTAVAAPVRADVGPHPPQPDFFWPYGTALVGAENLQPVPQPVVALVRGIVCGAGSTKLATSEPGTPADDVGKTVYVVDVLADGAGPGQRKGCGRPDDVVMFYFPASGRVANQSIPFRQGGLRADLDLQIALTTRVSLMMPAADGPAN
jgi:hypothetical protein